MAQRLRHWSHFGEEATAPANTVLYWVGHGWSDGTDSVLAHADSPFIVADDGVRPISLARAVQVRQRWANDYADPAVEDAWALVIIDACRAGAFAKQIPLGAPVCALLQHPAANQSADRAGDDATITVGLHTGIVTMNLSHALLTGPRNSGT